MKNKLILTLFLFASILQAQEKKQSYSFTLQQAIAYATQNNYSAINASRDIEVAKEKKWETTTIGLPQINGTVSYLNNLQYTKQGVTGGGAFGGAPGSVSTIAFGTKHSANAGVTLSQLIFDGSYLVGLQSAKVYLKISENAKLKTNQEVKEIVINSYGNVLLADESISIFEKNKVILEKTLSDTKQIFKNGLIEEENVEQLQITLASVNSALANVKRQKTIALNMLKLILGINLDNELILTEKLEDLTQKNVDLLLLQEEFKATNNIDYQIGENLQESKRLLLKYEKSKELPSLGAALNYGYNAFENKFDFFSKDQKWNNFANLGVSLHVPIFSSLGTSAKKQQAKIALEQATTKLTETEQKLKLQFEKARSDYEFTIEELATNKNNLKLAERIETKQQIKFKEGLSTSFNLSEAQRQLYTAQQTYLQSMVDVINKRASLEKIINKK
ncbi:TolC family protein [Flavobacterium psychrophilum]|uniref:TolC family protein n=1 Tax=Flavobacterium psychrophilum TaxID=96345 RepID=UPI000B7C2362|nr:TolC family protein [Flavobacterium psychrophilum]MBF2023798.1 TolC family protein [Flavobacterium psychrophilum]MCB5983062.1 TolC family protein [Flavobacterium psychrophilum]MCB5996364.1 TolC family protein [Flavobacterium psychrophilum]MCB6003630.1 TolC family protein [Flavobacterium psychrophilum]MCB6040932.1 TolC family protein [Flavobacterium psychrophilum]